MTMKYVRDYYGVPAKRGMHVKIFTGHGVDEGRITSACQYIRVNGKNYHPTWQVVYYDEKGNILKDTRE